MASRQLDEKTVTGLVADAAAAPSMHNAQPWRFRFLTGERVLLLRADPERAMPRSDPDNRALHIGCGAALFNLRVAAAHANLLPEVRVLPEPQDPLLLAAVHLTDEAGRPQDQDLARLHPAIAANPFFAFTAIAKESGTIEFRWVGDNGQDQVETAKITVA